nr:capsid protein [Avian nephritis virus]
MPGPAGPGNGGARPKNQLAKPKKAQKPPTQQKPSQQKPLKKEIRRVEKQVKVLKKRTNGPKQNDVFTTTVTLGTISGQSDNGLTRQIRVPFNPTLCKSSDGGSTTPLSIRGSMYQMWKVLKAELRATPLTGGANIVGSVGFMALTLNGLEATADSIATIKARKHVQIPIGRSAILRVLARDCAGPREGWWLTDTSSSPADSYGPAVDLMLAYKTSNLLNVSSSTPQPFLGTLWQVELKVTYAFSTYDPKPGLQTLVSQTLDGSHQVTIQQSTNDGSLIMTTNDLMLLSLLTPRAGGQRSGKSQTVWAVAGAAIEAAAPLLGPWGWLLKGGFWLVRKIFGATALNTGSQYQLYPSIEAAMADQPIYGQVWKYYNYTSYCACLRGHESKCWIMTSQIQHLQHFRHNRCNSPFFLSHNLLGRLTFLRSTLSPRVLILLARIGRAERCFYQAHRGISSLRVVRKVMASSFAAHHLACHRPQQLWFKPMTLQKPESSLVLGTIYHKGVYTRQGHFSTPFLVLMPWVKPWLSCGSPSYTWYWPSWMPYPKPKNGDWFLQMQNVGDYTTHTTSVGCYFVVAYKEQQKLVAFWHPDSGQQSFSSLPCLYNVDAGRDPVRLSQFIIPPTEVEFDDDDISLAGSCIQDEFNCVDELEREREDLMRRLRDLDLRRFHI